VTWTSPAEGHFICHSLAGTHIGLELERNMLAQLIPVEGDKPIVLKKDVILVGRKSRLCDLVVDRGSVSKLHCLIVKTDGLLFIRDLGSTNGTKVNGQRVTSGALLPGDELAFAGAKFRVHMGPDEGEDGEDYLATNTLDDLADGPQEPSNPANQDSDSDVRMLSDENDI
jgi:pSer/pThr/pTyr-binding forkhead associated (FHA) protein